MTTYNLNTQKAQVNNLVKFNADVDRLGVISAQLAELQREADGIKQYLKTYGKGVVEGNLFRAVIVEQERTTYDNDVLKAVVDAGVLEFAKRETLVTTVRITGRKA